MAKSCIIGHPKVRGPKGNIVDSKLHTDLQSYVNNDKKLADKLYYTTKNPEFIKRTEDILKYDENGEPTLNSIKKETDLLDSEEIIEAHNNAVYKESIDAKYNKNLNEKLRTILKQYGVSVGTLDTLEERLGILGVTDFSKAKTVADGLVEIIRLAKGLKGEIQLPEEFAHFMVDAASQNPIVRRVVENIQREGLAREILGEDFDMYNKRYEGDEFKLAREAAGKLLGKAIFHKYEVIEVPKNLWQRFVAAIKSFFAQISEDSIQRAIRSTFEDIDTIAVQVLNGTLEGVDISNVKTFDQLYSLEKGVDDMKKATQKIMASLVKRMKIYERKQKSETWSKAQRNLLKTLRTEILAGNTLDAATKYLEYGVGELKSLEKRLFGMLKDNSLDLNFKCSILRDIRNFTSMHKELVKQIRRALNDTSGVSDIYKADLKNLLAQMQGAIDTLEDNYQKAAKPLFAEFLRPFLGENIVIPFGSNKGKEVSVESLLNDTNGDISFMDRWLQSMADSSEYVLRLFDQAVKQAKERARQRSIAMMKKILALGRKLEQKGIRDTKWMYERDENGNLTGYFISKYNIGVYTKAKSEAIKRIKEQYPDTSNEGHIRKRVDAINSWILQNTEIVDGRRIPSRKYLNKQYEEAMRNSAMREFHHAIIDLKRGLDNLLPAPYRGDNIAPRILKDFIERLKQSRGNMGSVLRESFKDMLIKREDDTEYGARTTLTDFSGKEVRQLPIYFTGRTSVKNMNDLSTDVISVMIEFADMAINYDEMSKIVDAVEVGKQIIADRKVIKMRAGKPVVSKSSAMGATLTEPVTIQGENTNTFAKLADLLDARLYGIYEKDMGNFGKSNISKNKAARLLGNVTSINGLALNLLAGLSNVATGSVMMRIESIAGEFFTIADATKADLIYSQQIPSYLGQVGKRIKTNKLYLFIEKFNVMQDHEQMIRKINFDRKTWFSRMFTMDTAYFMSNCGEHWMHTRTALALANHYKLVSPMGNKVSLWDALEVVPIDKNDPSLGATLQIKQGYKKEDGTEFTEEDVYRFSRRSGALNNRMHGIFNREDMNAIQTLALGKLIIMFRRWIVSNMNRRFEGSNYNFDLDTYQEGFYRTFGNFAWQFLKDIRKGQVNIVTQWKNLDNHQKANMIRSIVELGHFVILATALAIIDWDDDKNRPWAMKMLEYQAKRLYTELGASIPGPTMFSEGLKLIQSPTAAVNALDGIGNTLKIFWIPNWFDEIESGFFEGHSKGYKAFITSPFLGPAKTLTRTIDPEDSIQFFE